jgi:hypothetical protein
LPWTDRKRDKWMRAGSILVLLLSYGILEVEVEMMNILDKKCP